MTDDRCDAGKAICPMLDQTALGNRAGAPFHVTRHTEGGKCVICGRHIDGPEMMPVPCDGSDAEILNAIRQLHVVTE